MKCTGKEWDTCRVEKMGCKGCYYDGIISNNDFIRTKDGKIDQVINNKYYMPQYIECNKGIVERANIEKHSENIIDLIEVDDYVNGEKVLEIRRIVEDIEAFSTKVSKKEIAICVFKTNDGAYYRNIKETKIKDILTKEQFERNCYKVGE